MRVRFWPRSAVRIAFLLVFGTTLLGCGADSDAESESETSGPRYAVGYTLWNADFTSRTSYLNVVETLESGSVSISDGIEFAGGIQVFGADFSGDVYVTKEEDVRLTKFGLTEDGRLEQLDEISFQGEGIPRFSGEKLILNDAGDTGYLLNLTSGQGAKVDLSEMEMEIAGSLDVTDMVLPGLEDGMQTYTAEGSFEVRRGKYLVAFIHATDFQQQTVLFESKMVLFDAEAGTFEVRDSPCAGVEYLVEMPDGDAYFSTGAWGAGIHAVDKDRAPAPCMGRLPKDSETPDAETIDLGALTGSPSGVGLPGPDGTLYIRALDMASAPADATGLELFSAPLWDTYTLDPDTKTVTKVDRPKMAGGAKLYFADGIGYTNESDAGFATTTLLMLGENGMAPALSMPGVLWGLARLR